MDKSEFILKIRSLFWSVSDSKLDLISDELFVETVLNYGRLEDVQTLFGLLGLEKVATIFRKGAVQRERTNYLPQVKNYYSLYFDKYAPGDTK